MSLNNVEEIIADIKAGKMVILMDDEDRENEGDIIMAAEKVTAEDIAFMARHACGLICLTLSPERCDQLELPLMVDSNGTQFATNFTLSIEASEGITTGISAADRATTVQVAVAKDAKPADIVHPGHIFPLRALKGGVLQRAGHTEAGCDLAALAGLEPAAVIVEIMNEDGTMARRPELEKFAAKHNIKIGTIADLIHYRMTTETTVEKGDTHTLNTSYGSFEVTSFIDAIQNTSHLALVKGKPTPEEACLVRVHQTDTLRDLLAAEKDNYQGWSIHQALAEISKADTGVLVLLANNEPQPSLDTQLKRFLGIERKAASSVSEGSGTYLTIGTGAQILRQLGVGKMRLLSSPIKFGAVSGFGLEIIETLTSANN